MTDYLRIICGTFREQVIFHFGDDIPIWYETQMQSKNASYKTFISNVFDDGMSLYGITFQKALRLQSVSGKLRRD